MTKFTVAQMELPKSLIFWYLGQNSSTTVVVETENVDGTTNTDGAFFINVVYYKGFHWKYIGN